jgi:hypothetical protein
VLDGQVIMDKRTLIAGFIVLAVGVAVALVSEEILYWHRFDASFGLQYSRILSGAVIFAFVLDFAGIVLVLYGAILPDPPVHY